MLKKLTALNLKTQHFLIPEKLILVEIMWFLLKSSQEWSECFVFDSLPFDGQLLFGHPRLPLHPPLWPELWGSYNQAVIS